MWAEGDDVIAYYALAPHKVVRDEIPKSISRDAPSEIPAILLAKLALSKDLHGKGLDGALLADALTVAINAMRKVGGGSSLSTPLTTTPLRSTWLMGSSRSATILTD